MSIPRNHPIIIAMKLRLVDVRKYYPNGAVGVDNINLDVDDGQMIVLLGPSGCGKTTLLRLISGLDVPEKGSIVLDGIDITHWTPKKRDIAMVFQNYALYPHMTVKQNLEFGLKSRRVRRSERKEVVKWAAGMLGLSEYLGRKPKELSGGQRQRVALGRAIVRKPQLYLFDEPLSNLDTELRMRMRGEILSLHRRVNGTSIYVTHDQVEAMSLADLIFIMKEGRIISSGTPRDLYENPPDLFTAGFLGFPSMNLLEGMIADESNFVSSKGLAIPLVDIEEGKADKPIYERRKNLVLGIRPEDFQISSEGKVTGEVVSVENLGRSSLVLVRTESDDGIKIVALGDYEIGENIRFNPPTDRFYLFEKATGRRIS